MNATAARTIDAPAIVAGAALEFEILSDAAAVLALETDWDRLAQSVATCRVSQTFGWALSGWQTVAQARQRRLACLVGRSPDGRLALVWAFALGRERGCRIAQPLGSEMTEYAGPLVADAVCRPEVLRAAWTALCRGLPVDAIRLPQVRDDGPLYRLLARPSPWQARQWQPAPYVAWPSNGWTGYQPTVSSYLRKGLRRLRRRIADRGPVTVEVIAEPGQAAEAVDWLFRHKQGWLDRTGRASAWLMVPEYRHFLAAMVGRATPVGRLVIQAMKVDGTIVAAQLSTIDRTRVEVFISTFDADWGAYSPGQLLRETCLQQACDAGLDYDFRIGDEPYKEAWSNAKSAAATVTRALTVRGLALVAGAWRAEAVEHLRRALRRRMSADWRRRIKRVLRPRPAAPDGAGIPTT